jgi:hypothetical protein
MRLRMLAVLMLSITISVGGAACSDASADDDGGALLSALVLMDGAGFHTMEEALSAPGATIDAEWLGRTRNARIAVATVTWPDDLEAKAKAFTDAVAPFQAALEDDDAAEAARAVSAAHAAQHALSLDAYDHLAEEAGIPAAGDHGH